MAADIKINLLPWREELREQKKKEFLNILVGVVLFGGIIVGAFDRYYSAAIDAQNARNNFLTQEITVLEGRIQEINMLQSQRNELLARMTVIQNLQGNRPIIVRLFDELAKQLAPRVFFTGLQFRGNLLAITGIAESNTRISNQLRNFSESDWFDKPNVTAIQADPRYGPQASTFTLSVEQSVPRKDEGGS
ncbi:MAG: PilN domain-containing protein [Proteobacteria bacterium]|nr:PilN domain-containing protein [Pseudomonadota bacterium]MDA1301775.1 PilN domain-containing protein [Pseudomonadota bacterium]